MYFMLSRFKRCKGFVLLPIAVIGVVIPLMCRHYLVYYTGLGEPYQAVSKTIALLHTCVPMMIAWWIVLLFRDFFNSEGNELLYYFYSQWELFKEYLILVCVYGVIAVLVFLVVSRIVDIPFFVLGQLECETLCIAALSYFCAFLLLNTGGSLLVSIGYCVWLNLFDTLNLFGFMSVFPREEQYLVWNWKSVAAILAAAVVLNIFGILCMRFRRNYK